MTCWIVFARNTANSSHLSPEEWNEKQSISALQRLLLYVNVTAVTYDTVEPRFNEPLCNEVLGITNDIFQPSNSVMYGKEPRYNESSI